MPASPLSCPGPCAARSARRVPALHPPIAAACLGGPVPPGVGHGCA